MSTRTEYRLFRQGAVIMETSDVREKTREVAKILGMGLSVYVTTITHETELVEPLAVTAPATAAPPPEAYDA